MYPGPLCAVHALAGPWMGGVVLDSTLVHWLGGCWGVGAWQISLSNFSWCIALYIWIAYLLARVHRLSNYLSHLLNFCIIALLVKSLVIISHIDYSRTWITWPVQVKYKDESSMLRHHIFKIYLDMFKLVHRYFVISRGICQTSKMLYFAVCS